MTDTASTAPDKLKTPLDVASAMSVGVGALLVISLVVAVYTGDKELVRDLAKNFVGPAFLLIVGYYFGSSRSSAAKDKTIADIAAS